MAWSISSAIKLVGNLYYGTNTSTGGIVSKRFGDTSAPASSITFTNGTSSNNIDVAYKYDFSLAATTGVNLDLRGGGGETDVTGAALSFTEIRSIAVYIVESAASTVSLRVGPQNQSNAWQGPFGGVAATDYIAVRKFFYIDAPGDGSWTTVDATHKVLRLYNPGAGTITGYVIITGTSA